MAIKTIPFDPAEVLDTEEDVAVFLEDAYSDGNPSDIAHALETVARARVRWNLPTGKPDVGEP